MAKKSTLEKIEEKVEEKAKELAQEIARDVKKIEKKAVEEVEEIAKKVKKEAKKIGKEVEEKTEEAEENIKKEVKEDKSAAKSKLEALKKKAKELAEKVEEKEVDIKRKIKEKDETAEKENALVPIEDYLKASVHLGTRVITPDMRKYVYRRRADGLAVFNTALLDDEIRKGGEYIADFAPERTIIVCKREAGWKAVKKFAEITGIRSFTKKYPAGVLTNSQLADFFEVDLVFICDPWVDKNALNDALRVKVPVMSICDTNNYTQGVKVIVPGNNKSAKSLGILLYLLSKLYCEKRKIPFKATIKDFVDDWDNLLPPK
jgi:small subunit ribosomal protein S2